MTRDRLAAGLLVAGAGALVVAFGWWWLIFSQVISNTYLSVPAAVPCLFGTSDICSLAQALCKGYHPLGLKTYWPQILWAAIALISVGSLVSARRRT